MEYNYKKQLVESLIFASDVPISENRIASIIEEDITPGQVNKIINDLNGEFLQTKRAFSIVRIAGGYQVNTRQDFAPWIKKLFKGRIKTRLSQASLESLAIVVFKQPISKVEVDDIRGVNSGGVIKNLLERNLIAIAGRADGPGKPLIYGTTKELLQYLGINDIGELPKPKEIAEIMGRMESKEGISENIIEALADIDGSDEILEEMSHEDDTNGAPAEVENDKTE